MVDIQKKYLPNDGDLAELNRRFWEYTKEKIPGIPAESEDKTFLFTAREKTLLVGGISGNVYWNGLEIDTLWVSEDYRSRGIGQKLVQQAEDYALENDAVIAFLKTVDAKSFYEKAGYVVYGVLEDRPVGTVLYHMKKRLS